ncbi:unnamed protein product, partial [Meganyctiphanes norvegica]
MVAGKSPGQFGEALKYDPEFKGPIKSRSCTDIICFLLFFAFLAGWGVVAYFAISNGDPNRLLYPTDSEGRVCGYDPEVKNKTFLFFFDLTRCASPKVALTGCPTPQVCVEKCPTDNWFYDGEITNSAKPEELICKIGVDPTSSEKTTLDLIKDGECAYYYVESIELARRCIPLNVESHVKAIFNTIQEVQGFESLEDVSSIVDGIKYVFRFALSQQVAEGIFKDIQSLWYIILLGFVVAMLVSFLYIVLLRFISTFMIYFSLVTFAGLSGFGNYYTLNKYLTIRGTMQTMTSSAKDNFINGFNKLGELETTWLVLFIIILVVFLVCLVILIFLRKRINIAIALIGQASKAVGSIMSTLFFPIIPYILQLIFLAIFCFLAVMLASAGRPSYHVYCPESGCGCSPGTNITENATCDVESFVNSCVNATCQFFSYEVEPFIPRLHIYNVFALFWTLFFVDAFGEMVLAGAFASWYWTFNKSNTPTFAVTASVGRTLRYHIGTIAFGSLIIAIVRMIRVIFEYIDHKIRQNTDSWIAKCLSCCCRCCLWCLEKFLKFINRNAYVYCAIYGKNFCVSAKNSFSLLMRNILRVTVLDKVTDFLLFIGKMVVVGIVGIASFFVFSGDLSFIQDDLPAMNYYLTPVVIITIGTFFIATAFFSVYAMAVDTIFLCFLEDCERNDGSAEKPYYMSKDLMKILHKRNKLEEK